MKTSICRALFLFFAGFAAATATAQAASDPVADAITVIRSVGAEGEGNEAAGQAWQELVKADARALPRILGGMDGANPLAANWLRSAVETIVAKSGGEIPLGALGEFLLDTNHDPRARRLAFELIADADAATAEALIPGMLNDPSVALRRGAVERLIVEGNEFENNENRDAAALLYRQALGAARDVDQIDAITKRLRELGREVDLPRHFGFLMHWSVIGPFHNNGYEGFAEVFPPEIEVDLEAVHEGKNGEVRWQNYVTADEYGMVDMNEPYGMLKEVTAFAYTEFDSESSRPVELRLGCKNGWKIWVNGEYLFGRDEYHRGMRIDQYVLPAQLKAGKNTILVKLCQDHQTEDWTVEWQFQLRVCDATGTAVLASNRLPTPVAAERPKRRERN